MLRLRQNLSVIFYHCLRCVLSAITSGCFFKSSGARRYLKRCQLTRLPRSEQKSLQGSGRRSKVTMFLNQALLNREVLSTLKLTSLVILSAESGSGEREQLYFRVLARWIIHSFIGYSFTLTWTVYLNCLPVSCSYTCSCSVWRTSVDSPLCPRRWSVSCVGYWGWGIVVEVVYCPQSQPYSLACCNL